MSCTGHATKAFRNITVYVKNLLIHNKYSFSMYNIEIWTIKYIDGDILNISITEEKLCT